MSFPKSQFLIKGFSDFFRIDQNVHDGGILLYVREDIPTKRLSTESIPSEYYLSKPKWLEFKISYILLSMKEISL